MGTRPDPATTARSGVFNFIADSRLTGDSFKIDFAGLSDKMYHVSGYIVPSTAMTVLMQMNGESGPSNYGFALIDVEDTTAVKSFSIAAPFMRVAGLTNVNAPRVFEIWVGKMTSALRVIYITRAGVAGSTTEAGSTFGGGHWLNALATISQIRVYNAAGNFKADTVMMCEGRS